MIYNIEFWPVKFDVRLEWTVKEMVIRLGGGGNDVQMHCDEESCQVRVLDVMNQVYGGTMVTIETPVFVQVDSDETVRDMFRLIAEKGDDLVFFGNKNNWIVHVNVVSKSAGVIRNFAEEEYQQKRFDDLCKSFVDYGVPSHGIMDILDIVEELSDIEKNARDPVFVEELMHKMRSRLDKFERDYSEGEPT